MLDSKFIKLDRGPTTNDMRHLTSIHKLQKRALRIISKSNRHSHHKPLCYKLRILDLRELYKVKALSFFHDYYHNKLPSTFSNIFKLYHSRNNHLVIKIKFLRTQTAATSIIHTLPTILLYGIVLITMYKYTFHPPRIPFYITAKTTIQKPTRIGLVQNTTVTPVDSAAYLSII